MSATVRQISRTDWIADERLYLTSDGRTVVTEGHKDAASLLAAKGQLIPEKLVKRLGLDKPKQDDTDAIKNRQTRVEKPAATR